MIIDKYNKGLSILSGLLFIVIIGFFLFFRGCESTSQKYNTYYAAVENVVGVKLNQNVLVGGYKVGYVSKIYLDKTLNSILEIKVDKNIKLPEDSRLDITSPSLFSPAKAIAISSGISDLYLENDSIIYNTSVGLDLNQVLDLVSYYLKEKLNK